MLNTYQDKVFNWAVYNFSKGNEPLDYNESFKGIVEEIGELSEALSSTYFNTKDVKDAIADIAIYILCFCGVRNWNIDTIADIVYGDLFRKYLSYFLNKSLHDIIFNTFRRYDSLRTYETNITTFMENEFVAIDNNLILRKLVIYNGKLAHSLLKQEQNIRGSYDEHEINAQNAVGKLLVYLLVLCDFNGLCFDVILKETWDKVSKRDWVKYPKNGLTQ